MKTNKIAFRVIALVVFAGGIAACYVKGRADGKIDAELRAVDGLMIAKYALEAVTRMEGKEKYEWLESVLEGAADMMGETPPPTIGEVKEKLKASKLKVEH